MKKILAGAILFSLIGGIILSGCSSVSGKLDKIKSAGEMVIYTDPNFPPFEFLGSDGTEIVGVDIEIIKAVAEELGVKATFKESNFDSIIMAIKGGKGDVAISGFTITEERLKSVDFSLPYIQSVQYLIVADGSELSTATLEDLAGKKVGVAKGYTGQFLMQDEIAEKGVLDGTNTEVKEYNSAMEAALDLKTGRIDAVVMDEYVAKNVVAKNDGIVTIELRYKDGSLASEEYGIVVPKGNEDLLEKINAVLKKLKDENKIPEWVVQFAE